MTDLHPWQVSTSALTGKLQQPLDSSIVLRIPGAGEEVIRLNKDGFHYRGQLIEDAGEAHRLMVGFLRQGTAPALAEQPVVPTKGVKLRYSLNVAQDCGEDRHPQIVMQILDITYQDAEPQPIADQWMFHGCKNVPSELPEYLTVLARWGQP